MKYKLLLLFFISFSILSVAQAQKLKWAFRDGTNFDVGSKIVVDNDGNAYVFGHFQNYYGSNYCTILSGTTICGNDVGANYLLKYDSGGNLIWARKFIGVSFYLRDVGIALKDNLIYLSGLMDGDMYIQSGPSSTYILTLPSSTGSELFLLAYDLNGNLTNHKQAGINTSPYINTSFTLYVQHLQVSENRFLVSGYNQYMGGPFNIYLPDDTLLNSVGICKGFVIELDSSFNPIWGSDVFVAENSDFEPFYCPIALDDNNNAYLLVSYNPDFNWTFDFIDTSYTVNANFEAHTFICKVGPNGNVIWKKFFDNNLYDIGRSLLLDSFNHLYISATRSVWCATDTGYIYYDGINTGCNMGCLMRISPDDGSLIWAKEATSEFAYYFPDGQLLGDGTGNIYFSGENQTCYPYVAFSHYFGTDLWFNIEMPNNFPYNFDYMAKYDSSGNFLWSNYIARETGININLGPGNYDVAVTSNGDVYQTGMIEYGDSVIYPELSVADNSFDSIDQDIYVSRLKTFDWKIFSDTLDYPHLCNGTVFDLPYSVNDAYNNGNIFTAYLYNPICCEKYELGSVSDSTGGTIHCFVPLNAIGSGYKLLILSDNPFTVSEINSQDVTVDACLSSGSIVERPEIFLSPNPASENLALKIESIDPTCEYQISNSIGVAVLEGKLTSGEEKTISIDQLENGVYYILFKAGAQSFVRKFVKIE